MALAKKKADAAAAAKRKHQFDKNTLQAAQDRAKVEQKNNIMSQIPKTAAGFNRDFKALKKNVELQVEYLKKIPFATLKSYFAKTEIETAVFSEILRTVSIGVDGAEDIKWAGDFMMTLAASFKFDMTLMMIDSEEESYISQITTKIRTVDTDKADQVGEAFAD